MKAFNLEAPAKIEAASKDDPNGVQIDSFTMLAYTGQPMTLAGWSMPVVVDLEGMSVPRQKRPVLLNHDLKQIVGHTETISKDNGQLIVKGVASGASAATVQVSSSSKQGFPWQASIGASAVRSVEVKEGKTARANGREWQGPIIIVRKSVLGEISFVPLGADGDTEAKFAAQKAAQRKGSKMDFESFVESLGVEAAGLSDDQKKKYEALHALQLKAEASKEGDAGEGKPTKPAKPVKASKEDSEDGEDADNVDPIVASRKAQADEQRRIDGIRKISAKYPSLDFAAKAIEEGWSLDKTELHAMRESTPKGPYIAGSQSQPEASRDVYAAAMSLQAGVPAKFLGEQYDEKTMNAAMKKEHRNMSIGRIAHEVLQASGVHVRAGKLGDDVIRQVLEIEAHAPAIRASGGQFSPISLSGILGDSANKVLISAFLSVPSASEKISRVRDLNDFKPSTTYRMVGVGLFQEVNKGGELKASTLQEASYTTSLGTAGTFVTLDRRDIINDDLGAFAEFPAHMGRAARLWVERESFKVLLANSGSFFSGGNANYLAGTNTALSLESAGEAEKLFLEMKDEGGNPFNMMPVTMLVPPALKGLAEQIYNSSFVASNPASGKQMPIANTHANKWQPVYSPFLSDTNTHANASSTGWYLVADPSFSAPLIQGYLRGQRTPTISEGVPQVHKLAIDFPVYFDFGVSQGEKKSAVFMKGVA